MDSYYRRSLEGTVDLIVEQLKHGQEVKVKLSTTIRCPWTHPVEISLVVANSLQVILLLGGFAGSPALKRCLNDTFGPDDLRVIHLDQEM
jgi:hypothetical protein